MAKGNRVRRRTPRQRATMVQPFIAPKAARPVLPQPLYEPRAYSQARTGGTLRRRRG